LYDERYRASRVTRRVARDRPAAGFLERWTRELIRCWEEVLGVSPIGPHDAPFLSLGASSLHAAQVSAMLNQLPGVALTPGELLAGVTIAEQAKLLRDRDPGRAAVFRWLRRGAEDKPTLVLIHPAGGTEWSYIDFVRALGDTCSVAAACHPELAAAPSAPPLRSVAELARYYADELIKLDLPRFVIGGHSFGGTVALEIACRLAGTELQPAGVILFDALLPARLRIDPRLRRKLGRLAVAHPALGRLIPSARKLLATEQISLRFCRWLAVHDCVFDAPKHVVAAARFCFPGDEQLPRRLAPLDFAAAWALLYARLVEHGLQDELARFVAPHLDAFETLRHAKVWMRNETMLAEHRSEQSFDGSVLHVACDGNPRADGWRARCRGPFRVVRAPIRGTGRFSPHICMFDRDNIALFAPAVVEFLDQIDRGRSPGVARAERA
jgi:pimeloyl-ACP methyl ester carboxylesterase